MTERLVVLSDPHGVLPTLDAVLAEPDVESADLVVVTGDLAAGPQPVAVLDRLAGLGDRVLLVRGNADRDLVTIARGLAPPEGTPAVDVWAAAQLSPSHVALLEALPHPATVVLDGVGPVLFCHGTPRDDDEVALVDTRPSRWVEVLAGVPDDVRIVCCGHTHAPFVRLVERRWVVNSGSTGMPYGTPAVPWVLLDSAGIHLRSTPVDLHAAADEVAASSGFPDVGQWVETYLRRPPSDVDALVAFGPRDGRPAGWNA